MANLIICPSNQLTIFVLPLFYLQDDVGGMLSYAFQVAMSSLESRGFRNEVLSSLVKLYRNLQTPDYVNMCQCLIFLDDPKTVAEVLEKLSKDSEVSFSLFLF